MTRLAALILLALVLAAPPAFAQSPESTTQMKLAEQVFFQHRVEYLMLQQARTVLAEPLATAKHAERANYARLIVRGNSDVLLRACRMLVGGTNLIGTVTVTPAVLDNPATPTVNEATPELVTTSVTDAALLSQIATFWNAMAGVETGS